MEFNHKSNNDLKKIVVRNEKETSTENLNYLYPNGHRMTHQMKWFKGSRDVGINTDIAA